MAKKTQLERSIDDLDLEIAVLQAARARLVKQNEDQRAKRAQRREAAEDLLEPVTR